jgi:hypothetical protein
LQKKFNPFQVIRLMTVIRPMTFLNNQVGIFATMTS